MNTAKTTNGQVCLKKSHLSGWTNQMNLERAGAGQGGGPAPCGSRGGTCTSVVLGSPLTQGNQGSLPVESGVSSLILHISTSPWEEGEKDKPANLNTTTKQKNLLQSKRKKTKRMHYFSENYTSKCPTLTSGHHLLLMGFKMPIKLICPERRGQWSPWGGNSD